MLKRFLRRLPPRRSAMDQRDMLAMQALAPLSAAFVPWTGSSLRPSALVTVLNDITIHRRRSVVECGGGISTLFIARSLMQTSGRLFTIEHDPGWASLLRELLKRQGLQQTVTIIDAPMRPNDNAVNGGEWYDGDAVKRGLGETAVDLLLVDGPMAYNRELRFARYPAIPELRERLTRDATIILDDAHRKGERKIAQLWGHILGVQFEIRRLDGGIAIARLEPGYHV
jgi:hypothetical protein